jgi:hypothetical protein
MTNGKDSRWCPSKQRENIAATNGELWICRITEILNSWMCECPNVRMSECPNVRMSECPMSECLNVWMSKCLRGRDIACRLTGLKLTWTKIDVNTSFDDFNDVSQICSHVHRDYGTIQYPIRRNGHMAIFFDEGILWAVYYAMCWEKREYTPCPLLVQLKSCQIRNLCVDPFLDMCDVGGYLRERYWGDI